MRAQKEVCIATSASVGQTRLTRADYLEVSHASKLIANSLRELDRRAGERGERMTVKFAIDKGNIKARRPRTLGRGSDAWPQQVVQEHVIVAPKQYEALGLPTVEQLPNTDFEVMNIHRLPMGTFHSKVRRDPRLD